MYPMTLPKTTQQNPQLVENSTSLIFRVKPSHQVHPIRVRGRPQTGTRAASAQHQFQKAAQYPRQILLRLGQNALTRHAKSSILSTTKLRSKLSVVNSPVSPYPLLRWRPQVRMAQILITIPMKILMFRL